MIQSQQSTLEDSELRGVTVRLGKQTEHWVIVNDTDSIIYSCMTVNFIALHYRLRGTQYTMPHSLKFTKLR